MTTILTDVLKKRQLIVKVNGDSMWPILHDDDHVGITKIKLLKTKINDVVLIKKDNQHMVHRVIYKDKNYLITKGDNNNQDDGKITKKQLIGIVRYVKRGKSKFPLEHFYLVQSSIYLQEINKINFFFQKNKIDFVFLKGLPINLFYLKKQPSRYYFDCDILIKPDYKKTAQRIFNKLGYKKANTDLNKKNYKFHHWEESFVKIINGFPIVFDIHYQAVFLMTQISNLNSIYNRKKINELTDYLIQKKVFFSFGQNIYPLLSTENSVLYFCLHFLHHNFQGIHRLEMINIALKRLQTAKLKRLINIINHYQLENYIYPSVILLNKYFPGKNGRFLKKDLNNISFFAKNALKIFEINPFAEGDRIQTGTKRFLLIFFLSPNHFLKKMLVFFNKEVIMMVFLVLKNIIPQKLNKH